MSGISNFLREDEEILFSEPSIIDRRDIILVLTNFRLIAFFQKSIYFEIEYFNVSKIQYAKKKNKECDANTISKFRIIDSKKVKTDFSFKGIDSQTNLSKAVKIINKRKNLAQNEEHKNQDRKDDNTSNNNISKLTEYSLKQKILENNPTAQEMYKRLVVEEKILDENEFWENFRSEISEMASLIKNDEENADVANKVLYHQDEIDTKSQAEDDIQTIRTELAKFTIVPPNKSDDYKESIDMVPEIQSNVPDFYNDSFSESTTDADDEADDEYEPYAFNFNSFSPTPISPEEFHNEAEKFADSLSTFTNSFTQLPKNEISSYKDAMKIISDISDNKKYSIDYRKMQNTTNNRHIFDLLRKHKMEEQILLLHYYSNIENIKNQTDETKIFRLKEKISELLTQMNTEKENIKDPKVLKKVSPIYQEMEISLNLALNL